MHQSRRHFIAVSLTSALPFCAFLFHTGDSRADEIDDAINAEMKRRNIPGLSLAIIDGGKIVKAQGYGVTERGGKVAVTPSTLFQAGSISKPVAALGALRIVEHGKISLDVDVNAKLSTWKVPENEFTKDKKVTLRGLLSHTAGMTVHGFPGYASDALVPTVPQVLDGTSPANTAAVRVATVPGSAWKYSGGGYTIAQQLMVDISGKTFPEYMQDAVLKPLGMLESSFAQPLPAEKASIAATGHFPKQAVPGRWHTYPEMAAAGLWTTASDLARFAIGIQQSLAGKVNTVISQPMTREMLTDVKGNFGLGLRLLGTADKREFNHNGRDAGFDAAMFATFESGQGAVIMINANDNSMSTNSLIAAIRKAYKWPSASTTATLPAPTDTDNRAISAFAGSYEVDGGGRFQLMADRGMLVRMSDGMPADEFVPVGERRFAARTVENLNYQFAIDDKGQVTVMQKSGLQERKARRIAPLMRNVVMKPDPKPARTEKLKEALLCCAKGPKDAPDSPLFSAGAKADKGSQYEECINAKAPVFHYEQDVSSHAIKRHNTDVKSIVFYQLPKDAMSPYLAVYLDAGGLIADLEMADD